MQREYDSCFKQQKERMFESDEKRALLKKREQFLEEYMSGCDGHATDRIVDYIAGNRG